MKKILDKLILIVIVYAICLVLVRTILFHFNLYIREWLYIISGVFIVLGLSVGIYYKISKVQSNKKRVILNIIYTVLLIVLLGNPNTIFILAALHQPEYIVEKDNKKLVACVSSLLEVQVVNYYEYENLFLRGRRVMKESYEDVSFDPTKNNENEVLSRTYYDEDGEVFSTEEYDPTTGTSNKLIVVTNKTDK